MNIENKINVPENAQVKFNIGGALTPQNQMLSVEAPEGYENFTIEQMLNYVLTQKKDMDANQEQVASSIKETMRMRRKLIHRGWTSDINGMAANPTDKIATYLSSAASTQTPSEFVITLKASPAAGNGVYLQSYSQR